jgi:hypothetical protein
MDKYGRRPPRTSGPPEVRAWGLGDTKQDMQTKLQQKTCGHDVVLWRSDQLLGAGFPLALAVQLAHDGRYDLHALIELAEQGCAPALAVKILAPL